VKARVDEGLGITSNAWQRGKGAFRDLRIRRIGLAVSSLIIVLLIAGIVMKIHEFERGRGPDREPDGSDGGDQHG
jgi:hypothetical protein